MDNTMGWKSCTWHDTEFKRLVSSTSKLYLTNLIVICVVNILLTISNICLNTITILAYFKSKELKQRKSYFLIALLSFNDLTIGVLGTPSVVALAVKTLVKDDECTVDILFELTAGSLSAFSFSTLFVLNLERYLCIAHPFFHRNHMTKPKLFGMVSLLWASALLLIFSRLFIDTVMRYTRTIVIIIMVILSVSMYISIYRNSRKTTQLYRSQRHLRASSTQDLKLAKSCGIVVTCTIICFTPYAMTSFFKPKADDLVFAMASVWATTFAMAASSINSIIFFWRNRILRHRAKRVLKCRA
ncbi:neuropeptide FF receptor 1-like [Dendronephthya gigantea]|uniref:neuropeptide FF receptor 1-like n=1 Tax=Dendronephthya gigantea TaxID=151771 RepID=UPI00106C4992|nr:neuropeptide FF receptor 1-like [Dendronephthya gigantea]